MAGHRTTILPRYNVVDWIVLEQEVQPPAKGYGLANGGPSERAKCLSHRGHLHCYVDDRGAGGGWKYTGVDGNGSIMTGTEIRPTIASGLVDVVVEMRLSRPGSSIYHGQR